MSDQTIQVKYVGTEQRWPEISITGRQSAWMPGQIESRSPSEASALLATGLFSSPPVPVLAETSPSGVVEFSAGGGNMNFVQAVTSPGGWIELVADGENLNFVRSVTSPGEGTGITNIISLTQAQYDALVTKDAATIYVIVEDEQPPVVEE